MSTVLYALIATSMIVVGRREVVALEATTVALVVRARPVSRLAALCLVRYAVWVASAAALTWAIWAANR